MPEYFGERQYKEKMMRSLAIVSLLVFGLILGPRDSPSAQPDTAAIVNSGSTNRPGFRIVVDRSGVAEFTVAPRRRAIQPEETSPEKITIPRPLTDRLYADLKAASPFASLPASHCMKSVSFGSALNIELGGEQTPDLSCGDGGNAALATLIRDCNEIVALFRSK
jgi:hypothetical protein